MGSRGAAEATRGTFRETTRAGPPREHERCQDLSFVSGLMRVWYRLEAQPTLAALGIQAGKGSLVVQTSPFPPPGFFRNKRGREARAAVLYLGIYMYCGLLLVRLAGQRDGGGEGGPRRCSANLCRSSSPPDGTHSARERDSPDPTCKQRKASEFEARALLHFLLV